ncbi:MAG: hypothetical protein QM617_15535 [Comamonas sp.]
MVKLHACSCPEMKVTRLPRAAWMRLLMPARRLFKCEDCGHVALLGPVEVDAAIAQQRQRDWDVRQVGAR